MTRSAAIAASAGPKEPGPAGSTGTTRRRGAQESRGRLLAAARDLFTERGYERTTVRDIGQRADVDPALIARYFGSKAALYLESVRPPSARVMPLDVTDTEALAQTLDRIGPAAPMPILHSAVRPHDDPELQAAAMAQLERRLLGPTTERAQAAGATDPRLSAEIAIAALAGIVLSRTSGAMPRLAGAPPAEVGALIAGLIADVIGH